MFFTVTFCVLFVQKMYLYERILKCTLAYWNNEHDFIWLYLTFVSVNILLVSNIQVIDKKVPSCMLLNIVLMGKSPYELSSFRLNMRTVKTHNLLVSALLTYTHIHKSKLNCLFKIWIVKQICSVRLGINVWSYIINGVIPTMKNYM